MAKNNGFGRLLFASAVAATVGGVAAYLHRKELEKVVQDIADALDAREEDGFFSVDLEEEPVFHKVPTDEEEVQEEDFADEAEEAPDVEIEITIPAQDGEE